MTKERDYWNNRYSIGLDSGWCSVGNLAKWRWKIVKKTAKLKNKSVLDVGCGDLRFWERVKHSDYTGIDISWVIIRKNFEIRPDWKFICEDAGTCVLNRQYDLVFCFEMLFHVMTEKSFVDILKNLNRWTGQFLFVSCWSERPEPFVYPDYQRHWQLEHYLQYLPDLKLVRKHEIKKGLRALYIFSRKVL